MNKSNQLPAQIVGDDVHLKWNCGGYGRVYAIRASNEIR